MEKMTYAKAVAYITSNYAESLPADVAEALGNLQVSLAKKNARSKAPTDKQIANAKLAEEIMAFLAESGCTSAKALAAHFDISSQQLTPIAKKLIEDGRLIKTYEKKVPFYSVI